MKNTNYLRQYNHKLFPLWSFAVMICCLVFLSNNDLSAQQDPDDCNSFHCWSKTYLTGGVLECSDYVVEKDEFESLDNWYTHLYSDPNHPAARIHKQCAESFFLDNNVNTDGPGCTILGLHEPNTHLIAANMDPLDTNNPFVDYERDFTSGAIWSKSQYHFGKFEAKISKMPGHGWWPSFWMWHWEEIDVMERFDESFFIYNSYPSTNFCDASGAHTPDTSLYNAGPHTFGMEWTPFKTTFFYNGQQLPTVTYRFYNLDGTPLDIDCGDNIPQGYYYVNPAFILPWRDGAASTEGTWFSPIVSMGVLPRHGYECCGPNTFCGDQGCTLGCNADWGNPVDENGIEKPGFDENTEMKIDYVQVEQKSFQACDAIGITFPQKVCRGEVVPIVIEALGGTDEWHIINAQFGALHLLTEEAGGLGTHKKYLRAMVAGIGEFELLYTNECGQSRVFRGIIQIDESSDCAFDPCESDVADTECCPPNTVFDGANCFYGYLPNSAYSPFLQNNTLYTLPNTTINPNNGGCPPGYALEAGKCNSGITVPSNFTAFLFEGGLYAEKNCDDVRDCCPIGYEFDGANCYSGVHFPNGYTPFIFGNSFYVQPNCAILPNDNHCCPAGFVWDGANCASGVDIPAGYNGFVFENSFYIEPKCDGIVDCCPVGSNYDGANCYFADAPGGYTPFIQNNTFYVTPLANNECPPGYIYDGIGCNSSLTYPEVFEGFIYGTTFYTKPHCPGDPYNDWTVNMMAGCPNFRFLVSPPPSLAFPALTEFNFTIDGVPVTSNGASLIIPYTSLTPGDHELCVSVRVPGHGSTQKCITFVVNCNPWSLNQIGNLCPIIRYQITPASWFTFPTGTVFSFTLDGSGTFSSGTLFSMSAGSLSYGWHTLCAYVYMPGQETQVICSTFYNNCGISRNAQNGENQPLEDVVVSTLVTNQITFSTAIPEGEAILYNSKGSTVAQYELNHTFQLNIETLPAGSYLLRVLVGHEIKTCRIVKIDKD